MINSRLWKAYCETLVKHPLRTRMATSGVLFAVGDTISQQGFEHRRTNHDFVRTARMAFYGSCIFAPLANAWFGTLQKVTMSNKAATVIARTGLDIFCWGSFITGVFCKYTPHWAFVIFQTDIISMLCSWQGLLLGS
jgi:protein Mpv17